MSKKKNKMLLLNNEEMQAITGGAQKCNKKGDTVISLGDVVIKVCASGELSCKPSVSTKCSKLTGVTIDGCSTVTLKPKL
jgi:hypothetical protein